MNPANDGMADPVSWLNHQRRQGHWDRTEETSGEDMLHLDVTYLSPPPPRPQTYNIFLYQILIWTSTLNRHRSRVSRRFWRLERSRSAPAPPVDVLGKRSGQLGIEGNATIAGAQAESSYATGDKSAHFQRSVIEIECDRIPLGTAARSQPMERQRKSTSLDRPASSSFGLRQDGGAPCSRIQCRMRRHGHGGCGRWSAGAP